MSEIWFIRHAQSTTNAGMITPDTRIVELTALGWQQAADLAPVIPKQPDLIIVTPYLRTQQTSEATQKRFPETPVQILPLHEFSPLSHLNYADKTTDQRIPLIAAYWQRNDLHAVDGSGAESFVQMLDRVESSLEQIKQAAKDFTLVFTHGRILQVLRLKIAFPDLDRQQLMFLTGEVSRRAAIDNCAVFKMTLENGVLRLPPEEQAFLQRLRAEIESPPIQGRKQPTGLTL